MKKQNTITDISNFSVPKDLHYEVITIWMNTFISDFPDIDFFCNGRLISASRMLCSASISVQPSSSISSYQSDSTSSTPGTVFGWSERYRWCLWEKGQAICLSSALKTYLWEMCGDSPILGSVITACNHTPYCLFKCKMSQILSIFWKVSFEKCRGLVEVLQLGWWSILEPTS